MTRSIPTFSPKQTLLSRAISIAIMAQVSVVPINAIAGQITPNPNNAGNTISITAADATNDTNFDNNGDIELLNDGVLTNNNLLVNHGGGTLTLNGSGHGFNFDALVNSSTLDNAGSLNVTGDQNTLSNQGILNNQAGGQITLRSNIGYYNHIDNESNGVINNQFGATLKVYDFYSYFENRGVVNNDGYIRVANDSYFENTQQFNNKPTGVLILDQSLGNWGNGQLNNQGTANISTDSRSQAFKQVVQNSGSLTLERMTVNSIVTNQVGGLLYTSGSGSSQLYIEDNNNGVGKLYNSGSWTHAVGHLLENNSLIQNEANGVLSLAGNIKNSETFNSAGSLIVETGGRLYGSGDIVNTGVLENSSNIETLYDGVLTNNNQLTNQAGGTLTLNGSGHLNFDAVVNSGTFDNAGLIDITGYGNDFSNQSILNNQSGGLIALRGDIGVYNHLDNEVNGVINNQFGATIISYGSDAISYFLNDGVVNNEGVISLGSSTYFLNNQQLNNNPTGVLILDGVAKLDGNGQLNNQGTATLSTDSSSFAQVVQNSGSLTLEKITVNSTVTNQVSGLLYTTGSGNSKIIIEDNGDGTGKFYNSGTWTHAAGHLIQNNSLIQNQSGGVLSLAGDIDNSAAFFNAGTLNIETGGRIYGTGTFTQTAGLTTVNGDLELTGDVIFTDGVLKGSGQIDVAANTLQVEELAQVNPGVNIGQLDIVGNVDLNGQLIIELDSDIPTAFDELTASGNINFDVQSDVLFDFNFVVVGEFEVEFVNAGSFTNFSNLNYSFQNLSAGYAVVVDSLGNDLQLKVRIDTDGDQIADIVDTDDDNDGVLDGADAFPLDATESVDTDSDGIGNNADTDDDGDGALDGADAFPLDATETVDTDSDGIGNNADTNDDNDAALDVNDAFPLDATETIDTDNDGTGNNADTDDDGDGYLDSDENDNATDPLNPGSVPNDNDGDFTSDLNDTDDDNDGVRDVNDAFPLDASESVDTDSDGIGNNADTDDDNDGVLDGDDDLPLDATESVDTDGDGIGNNADTDDDNDGVLDAMDAFPLDNSETLDTDGDGKGNNADLDDDADGILDEDDHAPLDVSEGDELPPVFGEMETLAFEATGNITYIALNAPDVTDNNINSPTVISDLDGGLALGEHIITWTATDFVGNQSRTEQKVIVEDTTAPIFDDLESIKINTQGRLNDITAAVNVTAEDLVDGEIIAQLYSEIKLISGTHQVELVATDMSGNSELAMLDVSILPELNIAESMLVEASGHYPVNVNLSGNAPDYPVEIDYELILNGDVIDNASASINSGSQGEFQVVVPEFALTTDTLFVRVSNVTNAFINDNVQSHLNIIEFNIAPQMSLSITQNNLAVNIVDPANGVATVTAMVSDVNQMDTHELIWAVEDYAFVDINNDTELATFEFDPSDLMEGTYQLNVQALENNTDELLQVSRTQQIIVGSLVELDENNDSDSDGISDHDEGYKDEDGDGIADYLDDDNNVTYLPTSDNTEPMQTSSGLSLSLGRFAQSASSKNAGLTMEQLAELAGPDDADTRDIFFTAISPIYNFAIDGLAQQGDSASVVLPLENGGFLPAEVVYRKYNTVQGWYNFIEDNNNSVSSALTDDNGNCPSPNDSAYTDGLTEGNNCIQLTIEDGGDNDIDSTTNSAIEDPGVLVVERHNTAPVIETELSVSADEMTEVILDASGSYDNEDDELTFSWVQIEGQEVDLIDTENPILIFMSPSVSINEALTFELTLTDGKDNSVEIIEVIVEQINQAPSVSINNHENNFEEGSSVTLSSQGTDPDDDSLTYLWEQVTGPIVDFEDVTLAEVNLTLPEVSSDQTIQLRVTISDGELSSSDTTDFTVTKNVEVNDSISSGGGSLGLGGLLIALILFASNKTRQSIVS